MKQTSPAVIQF